MSITVTARWCVDASGVKRCRLICYMTLILRPYVMIESRRLRASRHERRMICYYRAHAPLCFAPQNIRRHAYAMLVVALRDAHMRGVLPATAAATARATARRAAY